jgi:beta propeller repeat protein
MNPIAKLVRQVSIPYTLLFGSLLVWGFVKTIETPLTDPGVTFQVTYSSYPDYNPDVDGDIIVWDTIGTSSIDRDIQGYRLRTQEYFTISNRSTDEWLPRVSGDWVIWIAQTRIGQRTTSVLAENLATKEERTIVSKNCDGCIYSLDINADYIVWADRDVWLYHIPTQTITQVTDDPDYQDYPAVDAAWVVWRNQGNGTHIRGYNIETTETITLSVGLGSLSEDFPDISNGVTVWQGSTPLPMGGTNIFGKNLNTNEVFTATFNSEYNGHPRISGNTVVWSTYGSGNDDVYGYNMETKEHFPISSSEAAEQSPSISGNVVVWRRYDHEPNDWNIYGVHLYSHAVYLPFVLRP